MRARHAAEVVVRRCDGAVEADRDARDAGVGNPRRDAVGDQRPVGGQGHAESRGDAVFRDVEEIGTEECLTARQDEDRLGDLGDGVHQIESPRSVELA